MRFWVAAIAALCFSSTTQAESVASRAAGSLEITGAYVYLPVGQSRMGVGYMTLANNGSKDETLLKVQSDISDPIEMHDHVMAGDIMQMRKLDSVPIPVGTTEFKPGGLHLMLIQMKDGLKTGETHMVKLVFNEQTIEQPFLIKSR